VTETYSDAVRIAELESDLKKVILVLKSEFGLILQMFIDNGFLLW
jgi:hypothetical protein